MLTCPCVGCNFTTRSKERYDHHMSEEKLFHGTLTSLENVSKREPKRFLACSSGGQRGVILTGMAKQLYKNNPANVTWDEVAGISAGAFCAAYISQTTPETFPVMIEKLHQAFCSQNFNVVKPWIWGGTFINAIDALLFHSSLYSNEKMVQLIDNWFDPSKITRPLHIGVYNKSTFTYETISSTTEDADMRTACLASASVPAMLPTVKMGQSEYEDGGMRHIVPIKEIQDWVERTSGRKHVDVLVCYPMTSAKFTAANIPSMSEGTVSSAVRLMSDMMLRQFQQDLHDLAVLGSVSFEELTTTPCSVITNGDLTIRVLSPSTSSYTSLLNITPERNEELFVDGEQTAKSVHLKI